MSVLTDHRLDGTSGEILDADQPRLQLPDCLAQPIYVPPVGDEIFQPALASPVVESKAAASVAKQQPQQQ